MLATKERCQGPKVRRSWPLRWPSGWPRTSDQGDPVAFAITMSTMCAPKIPWFVQSLESCLSKMVEYQPMVNNFDPVAALQLAPPNDHTLCELCICWEYNAMVRYWKGAIIKWFHQSSSSWNPGRRRPPRDTFFGSRPLGLNISLALIMWPLSYLCKHEPQPYCHGLVSHRGRARRCDMQLFVCSCD